MLNVGDKVFISNYGAGIVFDIAVKSFFLEACEYITIYLIIDDMDLSIPVDKIKNYKIRTILDGDTIERALKVIEDENINIQKNWGKRYRKNNEKIRSGDIFKTCEVLRDLYYLKQNGTIPQGEEKILNKAESMVASEIMMVFGMSISDAYEKVRSKKIQIENKIPIIN